MRKHKCLHQIKILPIYSLIFICIFTGITNYVHGATFCVSNNSEMISAIETSLFNGQPNIIKIVQGSYSGFSYDTYNGPKFPYGYYNLTIEGGYTQGCLSRTVDPSNTILNGLIIMFRNGGPTVTIDGITIQNGDGIAGLYIRINWSDGKAIVTNNIIKKNPSFVFKFEV